MAGSASFLLIMWRFNNDKGEREVGGNITRNTAAINATDSSRFSELNQESETVLILDYSILCVLVEDFPFS